MEKTTAQDIMSTELITVHEGDTVENALKALINNKITGLPVIDDTRKMVGVLSEYDIIQQIARHSKPEPEIFQQPIEFSRNPFGLPPSTPLSVLVKHFLDSKFRRIPIVDENQHLVGIITRRDLMRLYFYRAKLS